MSTSPMTCLEPRALFPFSSGEPINISATRPNLVVSVFSSTHDAEKEREKGCANCFWPRPQEQSFEEGSQVLLRTNHPTNNQAGQPVNPPPPPQNDITVPILLQIRRPPSRAGKRPRTWDPGLGSRAASSLTRHQTCRSRPISPTLSAFDATRAAERTGPNRTDPVTLASATVHAQTHNNHRHGMHGMHSSTPTMHLVAPNGVQPTTTATTTAPIPIPIRDIAIPHLYSQQKINHHDNEANPLVTALLLSFSILLQRERGTDDPLDGFTLRWLGKIGRDPVTATVPVKFSESETGNKRDGMLASPCRAGNETVEWFLESLRSTAVPRVSTSAEGVTLSFTDGTSQAGKGEEERGVLQKEAVGCIPIPHLTGLPQLILCRASYRHGSVP